MPATSTGSMRRVAWVIACVGVIATSVLTAGRASTPAFGAPVNIPNGNAGFEPGLNLSSNGTLFVDAPTGVPSHSALWRSIDGGTSYQQMSFNLPWTRLPGGGDSDVATKGNKIWFLDLSLASNSVSISEDNGQTWSVGNPITTLPASDRQWIAIGDPDPMTGLDTVYALYALFQTPSQVMIAKSIDGGVTWPLHSPAPRLREAHGFTSQLEVEGSFLAFAWEDNGVLSVARSADGGATWQTTEVAELVYGLIPGFAMDGNTMAVSYIDLATLETKVAVSTDRGETFGAPRIVSALDDTNVFPWVDVKGTKVGVAWYGTTSYDIHGNPHDPNDVRPNERWFVRYAETLDAGTSWSSTVDAAPSKLGAICTQGLDCGDGRELGDFLTLTIRHDDGRSMIAYGGHVPGGIKVVTQS